MRQQAGLRVEWPDDEAVACGERVQLVRVVEHARPVEGEHRINRARQGVNRQRGRGLVAESA